LPSSLATSTPTPGTGRPFPFITPEELVRLATLDTQLRANLQHMPPLDTSKLWAKQVTVIENLEKSLAAGHPRSLIQMVMGAGETLTARNIADRLIKFAAHPDSAPTSP
jgi:type I restriction enzyme R subunit